MYQIVASTMDNRLYNFDYEFNPLFNLSEREMAETINLNMDIATKLEQLGVEPEQCVSWLNSNKTNNMETLEMEEESNDSNYFNLNGNSVVILYNGGEGSGNLIRN